MAKKVTLKKWQGGGTKKMWIGMREKNHRIDKKNENRSPMGKEIFLCITELNDKHIAMDMPFCNM